MHRYKAFSYLNAVNFFNMRSSICAIVYFGFIAALTFDVNARAAVECLRIHSNDLDAKVLSQSQEARPGQLRSESLRASGVMYLTHQTSLGDAFQILKDGKFKSAGLLRKENPDLRNATDGNERFVYFSWTGEKLDFYKAVKGYSKANSGATLLLPSSYIDKPSFHHFSPNWSYGNSIDFTAENFVSGLSAPGKVNTSVEVMFVDQMEFQFEDIRVVVSPKLRERFLKELYSVKPDVDWEKIVLERHDPYSDPTRISFADFLELRSSDLLLDIYALDKLKALELSRQYFRWTQDRKSDTKSTQHHLRLFQNAEWIYAVEDFPNYIEDVKQDYLKNIDRWQWRSFTDLAMAVRRGNGNGYVDSYFPKEKQRELESLIRAWCKSVSPEFVGVFRAWSSLQYGDY